ncbi:hypothetical protein NM688_g6908 [Phlebia brevispora]|uniref:Uncharacterized protein n=1 Tax=Phlebia brevispora TaxID=194682 RepID=A0ACC1SBB1_9APHY|nr:hypothetical protein NM688_g6908 [Phlebia brevispora]
MDRSVSPDSDDAGTVVYRPARVSFTHSSETWDAFTRVLLAHVNHESFIVVVDAARQEIWKEKIAPNLRINSQELGPENCFSVT